MPEDWWFASTLPNRDLNDEMEVHRCDKSNNYYIEKARNAACHALDYNRFSYSFFRTTNDHHAACACRYCEVANFIKSKPFIDFLNQVTGMELTVVNECFANRYSGGSWLATHSDDVNGRLAFVYHLTKTGTFHGVDCMWPLTQMEPCQQCPQALIDWPFSLSAAIRHHIV